MKRNPRLRAFVKYDSNGYLVPNVLVYRLTQPKLGKWIELDANVCCPSITAPVAPTFGVVDDTANTFNWTANPNFPNATDYEFTLDSGATYAPATVKPLTGLTGARAIGSVGVRVKGVGGDPTSATLFNTVAYT